MGDTDLPDAVDIQVDVESESTGEETAVVASASEGVSSKPKNCWACKRESAIVEGKYLHMRYSDDHGSSINEALMALFEDYRRKANPISDKGGEPQSQGNMGDDLGADYGGDAMAQFMREEAESGLQQAKSELEIYLQEDREMVKQGAPPFESGGD
ncbi:hypothetical protein COLO4_24162 [Corchorus olitorius]|uniref:Uncharacterized protein n=1 Tax=Corchorus olitorius TaxID=93759 RepID=A0A1R3ICF4_9ROSI|nr:hypothetical protein COLO4_24162 [Corchorus olitorius]